MPLGEFVSGALFYTVTLAASLVAAWLVVTRRFAYMRPLPRLLAWMVLGTGALTFAEVIPAMLGVLSRWTAAATALVWLVLAARVPRRSDRPRERPPEVPPSSLLSVLIAIATVGAVLVFELARLRILASHPLTDIDMLGFHLPGAARFIQTGTIWRVDQFLPGFATAQYPNNGDLLIAGAVVPWRDLAFVRFVPIPFFALTGVATYALSLELGATRAGAASMAAAASAVPAYALLTLEGLPDAISLALLVAALLFLVRSRRFGSGEVALAGLAFGLALGTKWYGATATAVVLLLWIAVGLAPERRRELLRQMAVVLVMIALGGGLWLLRNLIESGNPIYPTQVSTLFAGSKGDVINLYGYRVANYLTNPHVLRTYIWPAFKQRIGLFGLVLVAGLVLASAAAALGHWRPRAGRDGRSRPLVLAAIVVVLGICATYVITPGSAYGLKNEPTQTFANVRWVMPAVLIAAAVAGRAVADLGRAGVVLELGALASALDALHLTPSPIPPRGTTVVVAVVLGVLVVVMWRWRVTVVGAGRALRARPWTAGGLAALAVAVAFAAARVDQTHFDSRSYATYDPTFAWIDAHARSGHRVGVTGVWNTYGLAPTLPAFGPRLGNVVAYVGDRVRASLHLPASESTFSSELRRGRYDLLLIGLQLTGHTDVWAEQLGYRLLVRSARLALYAAPGRAFTAWRAQAPPRAGRRPLPRTGAVRAL
jgi:hypothetical protein